MSSGPEISEEPWRPRFRAKLQKAFMKLQQADPLSSTERQHCQNFRDYLAEHHTFALEAAQLGQLEFEILSIAFTKRDLEQYGPLFRAEDVSAVFAFGVRTDRRDQVRFLLDEWPSNDQTRRAYRCAGVGGGLTPISP